MSGPTIVAKQIQDQDDDNDSPFNGGDSSSSSFLRVVTGKKKRSASPDVDARKRNKSVEDGPMKKSQQTFEEPPWE
jgi:hypothetical protein